MDKMPIPALTNLLSMLEKEQDELNDISADITSFLEHQKNNWEKLEKDQETYAKNFVEEKAKSL